MAGAFDRKLRAVQLRCGANLLLERLARVLLAAGILATLAMLVERTFAIGAIQPQDPHAWATLAALAAATWLIGLRHFPSRMKAALALDERLGLKERFSSALALAGQDDAFSRAAVDQAHRAAEDLHPSRRFPVRPSRSWLHAGAAWVAAIATILFFPTLDALGYLKDRQDAEQAAQQLLQTRDDVAQAVSTVQATIKQLGDPKLTEELAGLEQTADAQAPAEINRQTIRKLGDLAESVRQLQDDRGLAAADETKKMLRQLRPTADGLSRELDQAMGRGEFRQAADLLRELQQKLQNGELSDQQRQALNNQLSQLSEQLQKLAEQNEELAKELEKAGLDAKLAQLDPEQLRKALEKQGLTREQIEKLMKKAAACRNACSACSKLGSAMAAGSNGSLSAEALAMAAAELDDLDALAMELMLSEASLEEIQWAIECLGQGDGQCKACGKSNCNGRCLRTGLATGQGGRGADLTYMDDLPKGEAPGFAASQPTRSPGKTGQGQIVASWYFRGEQITGRSQRDAANVVQAAKDRAAEDVSENRIPRRYEASVKKYFGGLEAAAPPPAPEPGE